MNANTRKAWLTALWQGALVLLGLVILFVAAYSAVYFTSWGRDPHWIEAFRDRAKLANWPDNVRWPWIHQDSQYWTVRVRLNGGPVILEGLPPHARYWSVTYYGGEGLHGSINNENVELGDDGTYRIAISPDPLPGVDNHIPVNEDVKRAVIEIRITLQEISEPVLLPEVWLNDVLLVEGVMS
jgi:hypothetical protein